MLARRLNIAAAATVVSPQARASYLALYSVSRRVFSTHNARQSSYSRSDFSGQGFSSFYETDQPTRGPLGSTSNVAQSPVTPKTLKHHLDQFVVGQERAKIVLSVAVYEHYLRNQEIQRRRDEEARLEAQAQRRASAFRHPVEGSSDFYELLSTSVSTALNCD